MPHTLGAAFDQSAEALRAAARRLPDIPEPGQIRTLIFEVRAFFSTLRAYPDTFARGTTRLPGSTTTMGRALADIRTHFSAAEHHLAQAQRQSIAISGPAGEPGHQLQRAEMHLRISQDILHSHRGPDGEPLSPYLHVLAAAPAQRYIFHRIADLAWETGRLADRLADRSENPAVAAALSDARRALHQATVLGRHANRGTMWEFGELPMLPTPAFGGDQPATPARLAEDCDWLVRAAFQAARGSGPAISGTDLQQLARGLALGHLLTGRTLLRLAEQQPQARDQLHRTADALREAAHCWRHTAQSFGHVVDLTDPREHPALPRYARADVRTGHANPLPRTQPHPAAVIVRQVGVRIGQLLYGQGWTPTTRAPEPRPGPELAATTDGAGAFLALLHRPLTAAQYLADAGPHILERARGNLVSNSIEHRPRGLERRLRWYPAPARQLDRVLDTLHSTTAAVDRAAALLAGDARALGTDLPRARLDTTTRRLYRPGPPVAAQPPNTSAAPQRSREPAYRLPRVGRDFDTHLRHAFQRAAPSRRRSPRPATPRI